MADLKDTASAPAAQPGTRSGGGFELRLERGAVLVRLEHQPIAPGVRLERLTLQIPDVKFPFEVGLGAGQFRHRLADLVELAVAIEPAAAEGALAAAGLAAFGLEDIRLAPREGFLEIAGRLSGGPAFTLEAGLLPAGDQRVAVVLHAPRVLGHAPVPAAALPHLARSVLDALGPEALPPAPLPALLRRVLAPRGWKLPRTGEVVLSKATVSGGAGRLVWDRAASSPAVASADPDLLAADEGARTFREAEALLAKGDHAGARDAYLAAGQAATAHPFAAERLLSLLAQDEAFHEEALDLAGDWLARRPGFEPALVAEGAIRGARGEGARASAAFCALARAASARGRALLALAAAEAALAVAGAPDDERLRAVDLALGLRRDHLPALRALRDVARARGDREALLRASRRLVAYEPEPAAKARAHADLGQLLLDADPAGARLHLDQALRLGPDDWTAQAALARACAAAGEPLRAVRALDRLRELLVARGDRAGAARAALDAGALWEGPLAHPENALLRYRDAADLAPSTEATSRAARAAEAAGQWAEAADLHAATLSSLDPAAPGAADLAYRTRLALADVAEKRLGDRAGAAAHLEQAAALAPADAPLFRRLVALERALGRTAEVLRALDRLAPLEPDGAPRAAVLAEAGDAALTLGHAGDARARFTAAVAADPTCRPALLGAARLARERGDAPAERDALEKLLPQAAPGAETAELLDRLASARERAGDLAGAAAAAAAARAAAPTSARLDACLDLARRAGDPAALAALLVERARASAAAGDAHGATEAWLERARLLAGSPQEALAALAEARALSPGDAAVLRAQADLAERTGDARLALGCLRALLAATPDDGPGLELRAARAAIAAGEISAAKDHAERALARDVPGSAEVLDEILARAGDDAARADVLARLGRHLEAARLLERHGDLPGARAALERAAADPAVAPRALPRLAELRLDAGDRAGAAAALLALARLGAGRDAARLALQAWATGRDPAALEVAVARDPRFAPPFARRAALRAADDPRAALADAEAALGGEGLDADERPALLALAARAAAAAGDGAGARRHLAAYCDAAPDDDAALERLAALHRAAGARDELAGVLARRLRLALGEGAVRVRLELSDLLAAAEPARAARLALDALTHDPHSLAALRALTTPPRAQHLPAPERAALLARLASSAGAAPAEAAAAQAARARLLADGGDVAAALDAAREAARLGDDSDELLELRADLASRTGDAPGAARALLERARRAETRGEPQAAERLAEAGLCALGAGVDGGADALRAALRLGPEPETARGALEALARLARERGDVAGERELLPRLVPLLPTGARPAALLRLSALALEAQDVAAARASAEEARTLAPRELAAVEACRGAALAAGDLEAVAELLALAAALDPATAGARLLDRARLLAALRRDADADAAFRAALALLPPDRALADEHARLRRDALPSRSVAEPIEAFALRCPDPAEAAAALRAAAALGAAAGDLGGALRCARGAFARTEADPGFAGPLLARVLYTLGSLGEALEVHRRLLDAGVTVVAADDAVAICRQAADLAATAGDRALALRALDELLRLRPQEVEAAVARFELDADRPRAIRALSEAAAACRSRRRRVLALTVAAEAALTELGDGAQGDALFARARAEAGPSPALALTVARRRAAAIRAADGASSPAHLDALHDAAAAAEAAGDRGSARDLLEEAIQRQRERGLFAEAAQDLLQLDALAAAEGDFAESGGRLRAAAALLREAGDTAGAAEALRVAWAANPESEETARRLEEALRELGPPASAELAELLGDRAARAAPGAEKAAALVVLAAARRDGGDAAGEEEALRAALAEVPGHPAAERRLLAVLEASRRTGERARLLLERSARLADEAERLGVRREAARALAASTDADDRDLAAEAWRSVAAADPADLEAARAAAGLLLGLGRREDAVPHLAALVRADPSDDAAAGELSIAYADRPAARAELFLTRAGAAEGERRAEHLREAAGALFASGDAERARATLRDAFEAWPADAAGFEEAVREASPDLDRLDRVLARRAAAVPAEAGALHRARGDALRGAGRAEDAIAAYQAAHAAAPEDVATLAALAATLAEARGDAAAAELDRALVSHAEASPSDVSPEAEAQARYRLGLALSFAGGSAEAVPHLERALSLAPHDAHAGLGWAAVAQGYADRGDAASALAAARARIERAGALGLETEREAAVEAEAELADRFGLPSALGPAQIELAGPPAPPAAPPAAAPPEMPAPPAPPPEAPPAAEHPRGEAAPEPLEVAPQPAAEAPPAPPPIAAEARPEEPPPAAEAAAGPGPAAEEETAELELAALPLTGPELPIPPLLTEPEPPAAPAEEPVAFEAGDEEPAAEEPVAFGDASEEAGGEEPVAFGAPHDEAAPEEPFAFDEPAPEPTAEQPVAFEPRREEAAPEEPFTFDEPAGKAAAEEQVSFAPPPSEPPPDEAVAFEASPEERLEPGAPAAEGPVGFAAAEDGAEEPVAFDRPPGEPGSGDAEEEPVAFDAGAGEGAEEGGEEPIAFEESPSDDPASRVAGWLASANALARAGGSVEEIRAALDSACDVDPDAAQPWRERAHLEEVMGDALAAARSYLAVWLRTEGDDAVDAALSAARLFELEGQHADAARAYRGALHVRPDAVPAGYVVASDALAAGDGAAAARILSAIDPETLPESLRIPHARKLAAALATAGKLEAARDALEEALERDPADPATSHALSALDARTDAWAAVAAAAAAEGAQAVDAAEGAARYLHAARLLCDRAGDKAGGIAALRAAIARARRSDAPSARATADEATAMLLELGAPLPALTPVPLRDQGLAAVTPEEVARATAPDAFLVSPEAGPATPSATPSAAGPETAPASPPATGAGRAAELERLAHERSAAGDTAGAIDALVSALEADPSRDATFSWLIALSGGDEDVVARAEAARGTWLAPPDATPWEPEPSAPHLEAPPGPAPTSAPGAADVEEPETGEIAFDTLESTGAADDGAPPEAPPADGAAADVQEPETGEIAFDTMESTGEEPEPGPAPGATPEPAVDPQALAREGRALMEKADWEGAHARLTLALRNEPSDLTLARDISRVAEKLRRWEEYVQLGEVCADAISAYDPLAAAARYRHFAQVLRERVGSTDRAAAMLEKALALVPEDPDTRRELVAVWTEQPATAPRALDAWLDLARKDPSDGEALAGAALVAGRLASTAGADADAARLHERARVTASLAAFAAPTGHAPPVAARIAAQLPPELRERVAAPGATGPLGRILAHLAPWLETLFPADLGRRGVRSGDRLDPARAPALAGALDAAAAALGARPVTKYLIERPLVDAALENTQPPSIVLTTGASVLDDAALSFLAARTLDLVSSGATLVLKFAPKDVGILLELACRFAGGIPPSMGLPAQRAGAFLAVLEQAVPPATRDAIRPLGGAAAGELAGTDPRALAAALRRTANRVALLYAGDPGAALRTLALLDRRLEGPLDPAQALKLPDLRDLALFALSDPFLELRAAVLG